VPLTPWASSVAAPTEKALSGTSSKVKETFGAELFNGAVLVLRCIAARWAHRSISGRIRRFTSRSDDAHSSGVVSIDAPDIPRPHDESW
jgi:hypothetical protein